MDLLHPNVRGEIPLPTQALLDAGFESSKTVDWNQLRPDTAPLYQYGNGYQKGNTWNYTHTGAGQIGSRLEWNANYILNHWYLGVRTYYSPDVDLKANIPLTTYTSVIDIPKGTTQTIKTIQYAGEVLVSTGKLRLYFENQSDILSEGDVIEISDIALIDLTQIFGSGNEPTDINDPRIAEIEKYAKSHPEYTTSKQALLQEYINWRNVRGYIYDVNDLVAAGFSVRDNVVMWEKGYINSPDGTDRPWTLDNAGLRTNFVKVEPGQTYELKLNHLCRIIVYFYDEDHNFISRTTGQNDYTVSFTVPTSADCIRVSLFRNATYLPDVYPSEIPGLTHTVTGGDLINSNVIKWRNVRGNLYTLGSLLPYIKHPVFNESVKVSDLEWVHLGGTQYPHIFRALLPEKVLGNTNVYCDLYTTSSGSVIEDMLDYEIKGAIGSRYVYIKDPRFKLADGSDLKAYLGDTRIWYEKE